MNTKTDMIIAKGKPITSDVARCKFNTATRKWDVTFNNGKCFHYNRDNVKVIHGSTSLNPLKYRIRHGNQLLGNITAIFSFKDGKNEYWHICFSNGRENDYNLAELRVEKSVLDIPEAKHVFAYLSEIASYISVKTEDDTKILAKQYERIDFLSEESAAAIYLHPDDYQSDTKLDASTPIFPFGCNQSQFEAVTEALSNRISVIQGPPGTGKTQTILNIVANLVMQGKTVQIVSNNNSAVDNIIEKLSSPKYELDFIAALLGRKEHKIDFINNQTGEYPDLKRWMPDDSKQNLKEELSKMYSKLKTIYGLKNELAECHRQKTDVELEWEYHQIHVADIDVSGDSIRFRRKLNSSKIMQLWQEFQEIADGEKEADLLYKLKCFFAYAVNPIEMFSCDASSVIVQLQGMYYQAKMTELQNKIKALEEKLSAITADGMIEQFTDISLTCFRNELAKRYGSKREREQFSLDSLWKHPETFLKEYPVVLSTTYTARSSLGKNGHFDYVIMDEASQVDVATGLLALSSASSAVIVGDLKQLPNVVTSEQKKEAKEKFARYKLPAAYSFAEYSFLSSFCALLGERMPNTLLREHYRCHPQIIGFCNQKFYNGDLVIMTENQSGTAVELITTVAGHHERERANQRQADVIKEEVLPNLDCRDEEIGIIAPYRNQVRLIRRTLSGRAIEIDTVHKFQGREKDVIIISAVDDVVTQFSDDPNLLNVAVSRAKKKLILVMSNRQQPSGSNVGDLIGYIRYNNCDVRQSAVSSVFDFLYGQYTEQRLYRLQKYKRVSEYDSENLMYSVILDELQKRESLPLKVVCHTPLNLLLHDLSKLDSEERRFVNTGLSHLDFLIYNRVTKRPVLAIEVDGYAFHKEGTRQSERDKLKDHILEVYGIPLLRFSTVGSGETEKLSAKLDELIN